jgi:GTPase SAR1 family protein
MYEITIETFFDTGLTSNEQKSVIQADGFLILYDVTNKFSLERAKIYYKKILQMRDPMHADAQSSWLHNNGPTTSTTNESNTQRNAPPSPVIGTNSPTTAHSVISKVPFVLGANKCDVDQSERQVSVTEGLKLADQFNCPYMEVSSQKKIKTVEELFREVIKTIDRSKKAQLKNQQRLEQSKERTNSFKLPKVGDILPKSVSESDNADANYVEMMKQRKRQQSVRATLTSTTGPTTSGTVQASPTTTETASTPDSARH